MTASFLSSYLFEVTNSLTNCYTDNFDEIRFGSLPREDRQRSWKSPVRHFLRVNGWLPKWEVSTDIETAIKLIEKQAPHFQWLYDHLADDYSRETLIKVLAYRALGHRRVKLPLNNSAYWAGLALHSQLANTTDSIELEDFAWSLHLIDLRGIGLPIRVYDAPFCTYAQFVLEQYRCQRSDGVDIAVEPNDNVIDAGACWGDSTLYFAHRAGPTGRIYSYEFVAENLRIFRRNLVLNPEIGNRVVLVERAAWDRSDVRLVIGGGGPGSFVTVDETNDGGAGPLTQTIDDLVEQQGLRRLDFIKMDIEGSELRALKGAMKSIKLYKPKLAISVYHRLADFFEVPEFLDSLHCNYRYYLRHYTIHTEETVLFAEAVPI